MNSALYKYVLLLIIYIIYLYYLLYIYHPSNELISCVYEFGPGRGKFRKSPVISS